MTTAPGTGEFLSLRRGNPVSPASEIPDAGGRQVVRRDAATSLRFDLTPAKEKPAEESVSLRRLGQPAAPEPVAPKEPVAIENIPWRKLAAQGLSDFLDSFSRKKQVPDGSEIPPSVWAEAKKRLINAPRQGWQILKEFVKSKHPYVSMGLGIAGTAALGIVSPELAQKFIVHSGEIRTVAAMSALGLATIESVIDRETRFGRVCKVLRLVASDVALASMVSPLGAGIGEWGHNIISNISISGAVTEPTHNPTATDVSRAVATVVPSETHTATATPHAEASATPPATPGIQPTWEAGHVPTQGQLDWASSHSNMTPIDIDSKGGADFYAYNLDTSDPNPEAYVHIKTGQVFYETPDGKWAVDINKDGIPDALYSQSPVPETSGSGRGLGLARPVSSGMREGDDPPPLENINIAGDSTPDLFYDGSNWQLDINGDGSPDQPVEVDGLVNNGGVWDWSNIKITSPDETTEWKFEDSNPETGGVGHWVQSDLLSPIERGVHDVNPDVTISAGQGKWHAGENYLSRILSNHSITNYDTDLARNLSKGEGANTIAVDAVKDVLESHNVPTTVDGSGTYHVNVDPSYNQEIGARIQTTVDKINGWFTPDMDDAEKNKFLAEMSRRGLIEVKNLTVEQLGDLSKLAAALQR